MRAIDTNVAARFLLGDDPHQAAVAATVIQAGVHVPVTVLMELGWLLASRYAEPRAEVAAMLLDFIDLASVHVDDAERVTWALGRYAGGADLPDMLHMIGAASAQSFATFDRGVARMVGADSPMPIETLA